jgi:3-(3-hydroxy-phenyl)propionate hydroxylase
MTQRLSTEPNIAAPDDFYERLIDMHRDLTDAESRLANARLILLLANHIGDAGVLAEAIAIARGAAADAGAGPQRPAPDVAMPPAPHRG